MGIILGLSLSIGVFVGLLISVALAATAIILAARSSKRHLYVWQAFTITALALLPLLAYAIYSFPFDTGSPGSNYRILFKYYLITGFAYAASPGVAAVLSFFAVQLCPRRAAPSDAWKT